MEALLPPLCLHQSLPLVYSHVLQKYTTRCHQQQKHWHFPFGSKYYKAGWVMTLVILAFTSSIVIPISIRLFMIFWGPPGNSPLPDLISWLLFSIRQIPIFSFRHLDFMSKTSIRYKSIESNKTKNSQGFQVPDTSGFLCPLKCVSSSLLLDERCLAASLNIWNPWRSPFFILASSWKRQAMEVTILHIYVQLPVCTQKWHLKPEPINHKLKQL